MVGNPCGVSRTAPDGRVIIVIAVPPVRRRLVGGALRRYRENLGFTLDDAARILECDRSKVSRIETGQRGMVITNKVEFQAPYNKSIESIDHQISDLRTLTIDNPNQTQRIDRLRPVVEKKLAEMRSVLDLLKTGVAAAQARVSDGEGREWMQEIRVILDEMDGEEARLLTIRARDADEATGFTRKLFAQYGEAVEDLEVRRASLEDTYMALVREYER